MAQPKLLTLADPNGDARAVVSGASQAEAHLKELQQPQHVQADKATVAEQPKFYTGPMDVDDATKALAEKINQTYWDSSGKLFGSMHHCNCRQTLHHYAFHGTRCSST